MLTNTQIKGFKPQVKLYRNADSHGLALEVATSGSKIWIHRYRFNKKATMMTLGHYPEMSLLDARQARDANKQLLNKQINPKARKQVASNKRLFKDMFVEWHETQKTNWSPSYAEDVMSRAQNHVFAHIGDMYVDTIDSSDVIRMLTIIQDKRAFDTLHKMKAIVKRVFQYCIIHKVSLHDPTSSFNKDLFSTKESVGYASITKESKISGLLKMIDCYKGSYEVCTALKMAPYLFLRPIELAGLPWSEIDFDERLIRISPKRMKMRKTHHVPLSKQAVSILEEMQQYSGTEGYVFPQVYNQKKAMSENTLLYFSNRLGYAGRNTIHGFRSVASTVLNESSKWSPDVIELQLAHQESNKVRKAYNRAEHLDERRKMMEWWSDYIDSLMKPADVIYINKRLRRNV